MPDDRLDRSAALDHLRTGIAAIREVLATTELTTGVPACPGWDLRELARHLGEVHRWVVGAITEGHPDTRTPPGPHDRDALLAWYDEGAQSLVELLARTDPDAPCWTFGPRPRTARFWFRRQAHEHAVHAVDARTAAGAPQPVDAVLALDGIDEVVTVFFPRQVRLGRVAPLTRSLAVTPAETCGATWLLAGDGTGHQADPRQADARVGGPAEALYLLLWRRIGLDDRRVRVTGDPDAVREVLGTAIVP